jgi:hypothetical protein
VEDEETVECLLHADASVEMKVFDAEIEIEAPRYAIIGNHTRSITLLTHGVDQKHPVRASGKHQSTSLFERRVSGPCRY